MNETNRLRSGRKVGSGFTLIELLVVVAIIAILAAILLPALSRAKQQSQGVYCENNIRQVQLAWNMYAHDFNDVVAGNNWQEEQAHDTGANGMAVNWISGWEELGYANTSDNWLTETVLQPPQFGGVVIWGSARIKDQFKSCAANNADMLWLQARASFAVR
ncbi:MAG: prepilin-type N-terminal cleavage/methylation domain-containing protein [Limisphaerales bacterium]